jgi:integrase
LLFFIKVPSGLGLPRRGADGAVLRSPQEGLRSALGEGRRDEAGSGWEAGSEYGLHALRHAAAALFIEQGMSPKRVQTIMGHSSVRLTYDVYGYLFPSEDEDQAAMAEIQVRLLGA